MTHPGLTASLAAATREVLLISTMASPAAEEILAPRVVDHANLRRGVRYRLLLPDRVRFSPLFAQRLDALARSGAEIRTAAEVPMDALIVDSTLAALPGGHELAMFRLPSVVTAVAELFERVWPSGSPLDTGDVPDCGGLTERERELLTLLSLGSTDESAAARMDISVRTVRRTVAGIMDRLGARSRFQAGAQAADRGWLLAEAG